MKVGCSFFSYALSSIDNRRYLYFFGGFPWLWKKVIIFCGHSKRTWRCCLLFVVVSSFPFHWLDFPLPAELNPTTTKRKLLKADFDRLLLNFDFNQVRQCATSCCWNVFQFNLFQEDDEDLEEVPPGSPPRMSSSFNTESFSLKAELSPALNSHGDCSHRMHCNPNFSKFCCGPWSWKGTRHLTAAFFFYFQERDPSPRRHSIPAISRTQNSFSKSLSHNSHLCSYSQDQRRLNGQLPCLWLFSFKKKKKW